MEARKTGIGLQNIQARGQTKTGRECKKTG
jgi:hypothetical protein